jgi:hypothetical protein
VPTEVYAAAILAAASPQSGSVTHDKVEDVLRHLEVAKVTRDLTTGQEGAPAAPDADTRYVTYFAPPLALSERSALP